MSHAIFDIETCPLDKEKLLKVMPIFDPAEVALGNTKDPEKIKVKIAEAEKDHEENFFRKAALSAQTGRVLVVGMLLDTGSFEISEGDEAEQLKKFWNFWMFSGEVPLIGFNCKKFDVPFLARRSWILGIKTPRDLLVGRYINDRVVDLMDRWQFGLRESEPGSCKLNSLLKACGLPEKTGSGADFANTYVSGADGRETALAYVRRDLTCTRDLAQSMGVIEARRAV